MTRISAAGVNPYSLMLCETTAQHSQQMSDPPQNWTMYLAHIRNINRKHSVLTHNIDLRFCIPVQENGELYLRFPDNSETRLLDIINDLDSNRRILTRGYDGSKPKIHIALDPANVAIQTALEPAKQRAGDFFEIMVDEVLEFHPDTPPATPKPAAPPPSGGFIVRSI